MRKIFFTVGPTQEHPKLQTFVREAFKKNIISISHRGTDFQSIFAETSNALRHILNLPSDFHIFFLSSATEAMERVVENCAREKTFHLVNGAFSKRFLKTAEELKKSAQKTEVDAGLGFDLARIEISSSTELVCLVHNETSTGVATDIGGVYALKKRYPEMLFAVDIVSSAPYADIDYSLVDCAFFSVQKGFGMPAGLGVLLVNGRCIEKSRALEKEGVNVGTYHKFSTLLTYAEKNQTPETPNVLGIYLLGRIAEAYQAQGIEKIRKATNEKAAYLYDFFEHHGSLTPFVKNEAWRSKTVVTVEAPGGSRPVIDLLKKRGFIVGSGYGERKETQIRIGNFPMHRMGDIKLMLKAL